MAKLKRTIADLPHCNSFEAAGIFGMGPQTFKPLYKDRLYKIIRSQESAAGYARQYLLMDVFTAAFPEASTHTLHMMANEWLMQKANMTVHNRRKQALQRKKAAKGA